MNPQQVPIQGPIILVDGGGSKTKAVLIDDTDQRQGEGVAGPSNLMSGIDAAHTAIDAAVSALPKLPSGGVPLVCAMAGSGNGQLRDGFLASARRPTMLMSDGYAAMIGALGNKAGICLVAGTGTIGYSMRDDKMVVSAGGWGLKVGDGGSGAWIGRAALVRALKIIDGQSDQMSAGFEKEALDAFARRRVAQLGSTRSDILAWVKDAEPADFASLCPDIFRDAGAGHPLERVLLCAAGKELQDLWTCLDPDQSLPLTLIGGLADPIGPYLPEPMRQSVVRNAGDAIDGLLAVARGRAPAEQPQEVLF